MNKQGNAFIGIILAVFIYMMGVLVIPFFQDDIVQTRIDLDCTNLSISDGTKMTCLVVDTAIPYYIWLFLSVALGFIASKLT